MLMLINLNYIQFPFLKILIKTRLMEQVISTVHVFASMLNFTFRRFYLNLTGTALLAAF